MNTLMLPACVAAGLTASWSAWVLLSLKAANRKHPEASDAYEQQRLTVLRDSNATYRFAEQLVRELVVLNPLRGDAKEARLQLALSMQPNWRLWRTNEFVAIKMVEAAVVAVVLVAILAWVLGVPIALLVGGAVGLLYPVLSKSSILSRLKKQLNARRSRLPFVVDQIALMMQSGANFEESLQAIVDDNDPNPLTSELATVLHEINAGVTRREALLNLRQRIPSEEIEEFVFAVTKGEELGTPLSEILLEQSEQMRVKRSLWGEKAAAEAEVQIVFPGMLVMIACLIVVLGPIMLPPIVNLFSGGE